MTCQLTSTTETASIPQSASQKPAAHVAKPQLPEKDRNETFRIRRFKETTGNSGRDYLEADV